MSDLKINCKCLRSLPSVDMSDLVTMTWIPLEMHTMQYARLIQHREQVYQSSSVE